MKNKEKMIDDLFDLYFLFLIIENPDKTSSNLPMDRFRKSRQQYVVLIATGERKARILRWNK